MNSYELLLFAHIFGAVTWVGGALSSQVLAAPVRATNDPPAPVSFAHDVEWIGLRVFLPASIVLLLSGIGLVLEGDWGFSTMWVLLGLAAYALSVVTGALFLAPESGRITALLDARGAEDQEVQNRIHRVFLTSRIELMVLILIVFDMVVNRGA
jgi:uncharacterized membrane protein